jgi:hypothetical protein
MRTGSRAKNSCFAEAYIAHEIEWKFSDPFGSWDLPARCLLLCSLSLLLSCCHELQPCRNVTTSEEISPNGQLKAVTFRRLCPEEHSITTDVSIIRANEALPNGNGNVFGYDNEIAIRVSWLSDSRLAVYTYADPAKATKIERAGNVSIEYSRIIETVLVTPPPTSAPNGAGTPAGAASRANVEPKNRTDD